MNSTTTDVLEILAAASAGKAASKKSKHRHEPAAKFDSALLTAQDPHSKIKDVAKKARTAPAEGPTGKPNEATAPREREPAQPKRAKESQRESLTAAPAAAQALIVPRQDRKAPLADGAKAAAAPAAAAALTAASVRPHAHDASKDAPVEKAPAAAKPVVAGEARRQQHASGADRAPEAAAEKQPAPAPHAKAPAPQAPAPAAAAPAAAEHRPRGERPDAKPAPSPAQAQGPQPQAAAPARTDGVTVVNGTVAAKAPAQAVLGQAAMLIEQAAGSPDASAQLTLRPDGLGQLQALIRTDGEGVRAILVASQPEAAELLAAQAVQLEQRLTAAGVNVLSVDVRAQADANARDGFRSGSGQGSRKASQVAVLDVSEIAAAERAQLSARLNPSSLLDLIA